MTLRLCYVSKWSTDRAVIREKHIHLCIDGISHFLTLTAHGMLVDLFSVAGVLYPMRSMAYLSGMFNASMIEAL